MKQMSLAIARDVHEIKKDYFRIIQGIEEEIGSEYEEESMSFQDILQILQSSTYHMIAAKGLDIKLVFSCNDNPGGGQWTRHFGAPSAQHFRDGIFDKV